MGDSIRKTFYDDQEPIEEFLVEYKEETQLEIHDIQLKEGLPQDTANKNLYKYTEDSQKLLVTPIKGMEYIYETATNMPVCVENYPNPLIIDSGSNFAILAKEYLEKNFQNWQNQILPTKKKNCKCTSGKMTTIGTIIKEIIITHRKGNITLNQEFLVFEDAQIQGFLLGTDCKRMNGIDIYKSKKRNIIIGGNKEMKFSLDIYHLYNKESLE
ncbi:hypothetical protein O181_027715 [Austropuccinia psidii MF-1]|uniref:Uncharacterized protein n=1 Tax=Austropuccinia psidii MF-1 TaxID=1389203 RepID=A0A9Q3CRW9_9BASI|nr:hypothetical protein [Austropuccinia psidii MF-1]